MNSSAIALREPQRGYPFGGGGVHCNGGLGESAPINLFTGIQVTHTNQRRTVFSGHTFFETSGSSYYNCQ